MSDQNVDTTEPTPDELTLLKQRANLMGIPFHPSIGLEKLRAKVIAKQNEENKKVAASPYGEVDQPVNSIGETRNQRIMRLRKEATKLVRIRLTCMNPTKREHHGELFSVGNSTIGQLKKFVPYNSPWYIPNILLDHIKNKKCQIFIPATGPRGEKIREGKLINEYAVEVLDPLTMDEITELAQRQAMASGGKV